MGIDGTSDSGYPEDRPEDKSTTTGESDKRAEQPSAQQASDSDTGPYERSETLTREEYADDVRAQGAPMPRDGTPAGEAEDRDEPTNPAGTPAEGAEDDERAEPRDRETYADDMRAEASAPGRGDAAAAPDDDPAEPASGVAGDAAKADGDHVAEPLGRDEYADEMHDSPASPAEQRQEGPHMDQPDAADDAGGGTPETRSDHPSVQQDDKARDVDGHVVFQVKSDDAELRREPGVSGWGQGSNVVGEKPGHLRPDPDAKPVYVDGQKISEDPEPATEETSEHTSGSEETEITGNAGDGIWVGGLPGETPGRVGDTLDKPDEQVARTEKLRGEFYKKAEDIFDASEKIANRVDQFFQRPPTHAIASVPDRSHHAPDASYGTVDAGHLATAGLVVGVLLWELGRWTHEKFERAKGT